MRARIPTVTETILRRAVELGMFDTMSDAIEAACAHFVDAEVEPKLASGDYVRSLQTQRRLDVLARSASRGPTPAEMARELVAGLKRQSEVDGDHARAYILQVELELVEKGGRWERRVLEILNSYPRWLEIRERS